MSYPSLTAFVLYWGSSEIVGECVYYIYIFEDLEQGVTKVGISNNVYKRLSRVEAASGRNLELVYTESHRDKQAASDREYRIHNLLKGYRRRGEWFNLTFKDILGYLDLQGDIISHPKHTVDYHSLVTYLKNKHEVSHPDSPMMNPTTKRSAILLWLAIRDTTVDLTPEGIESRIFELENRSYSEWLQESPCHELDVVLARLHQSYCPNCGSGLFVL